MKSSSGALKAKGQYLDGYQADPLFPQAYGLLYLALLEDRATYEWSGIEPIVPQIAPPSVGPVTITRSQSFGTGGGRKQAFGRGGYDGHEYRSRRYTLPRSFEDSSSYYSSIPRSKSDEAYLDRHFPDSRDSRYSRDSPESSRHRRRISPYSERDGRPERPSHTSSRARRFSDAPRLLADGKWLKNSERIDGIPTKRSITLNYGDGDGDDKLTQEEPVKEEQPKSLSAPPTPLPAIPAPHGLPPRPNMLTAPEFDESPVDLSATRMRSVDGDRKVRSKSRPEEAGKRRRTPSPPKHRTLHDDNERKPENPRGRSKVAEGEIGRLYSSLLMKDDKGRADDEENNRGRKRRRTEGVLEYRSAEGKARSDKGSSSSWKDADRHDRKSRSKRDGDEEYHRRKHRNRPESTSDYRSSPSRRDRNGAYSHSASPRPFHRQSINEIRRRDHSTTPSKPPMLSESNSTLPKSPRKRPQTPRSKSPPREPRKNREERERNVDWRSSQTIGLREGAGLNNPGAGSTPGAEGASHSPAIPKGPRRDREAKPDANLDEESQTVRGAAAMERALRKLEMLGLRTGTVKGQGFKHPHGYALDATSPTSPSEPSPAVAGSLHQLPPRPLRLDTMGYPSSNRALGISTAGEEGSTVKNERELSIESIEGSPFVRQKTSSSQLAESAHPIETRPPAATTWARSPENFTPQPAITYPQQYSQYQASKCRGISSGTGWALKLNSPRSHQRQRLTILQHFLFHLCPPQWRETINRASVISCTQFQVLSRLEVVALEQRTRLDPVDWELIQTSISSRLRSFGSSYRLRRLS